MTLFHAVACLVVCLAQPRGEPPIDLAEGVHGLTGRVAKVIGQDLILIVEQGREEKWLRLKTAGDSRFALVNVLAKVEKTESVMKPIRLKDLREGQKVGVTIYVDGKSARLLTCVATGPTLGRERVFEYIAALGGKSRKLPTYPGSKEPERWEIDLSGTKARDRDLMVLSGLPEIADLNLAFTEVTDEGLKHLRVLRELGMLDLTGTKVTDDCLATLRGFSKLRRLIVAETAITKAAADALLRNFPNLKLCRLASGKRGQFRIIEAFREGKLHHRELMIADTLFAIAFPHGPAPWQAKLDLGRIATTYYHCNGPVGQILAKFNWFWSSPDSDLHRADARLPTSLVALLARPRMAACEILPGDALVGLWSQPAVAVIRINAGTHACYGQPFQFFDFYDNTPALQAFSVPPKGEPRVFHFIHDARQRGCQVRVLKGEERGTLARKGPKQFYSALFAEITREDLRDVNTSLMTVEGMADLMGSLNERGVLCYHVSHRYHNFALPLADAAKKLGFACKMAKDRTDRTKLADREEEHFGSAWFVVARKAEYLEHLRNQGDVEWSVPEATGRHVWRDGQPHDLKPLAYKW
jgi:hypothetical protein